MLAQGSTHLGQRENNEDFFLVDLERNLFIVADGMGGHRAGEIASALAVKAVKEYLSNIPGINAAAAIREAVQAANYQVFVHASLEDALEGMGTTLTVLWIVGRTGYVAHVGDSRAYLIRDGAIDRITCDHSLVQEMVENGGLSEYEARIHPQRNILTRAVGTQSQALVDVDVVNLKKDILLLCTDGLNSVLSDEEICNIVTSSTTVTQSSSTLVNCAAQRGGQDNITAIVVL